MKAKSLKTIAGTIAQCDACPRLRLYCTQVGQTKRRAYLEQTYWAKPVPGFGDIKARLWILGLAPGAHGANRTGRVFTGDRSGDFLFAALHRCGFANQPTSIWRNDGLELSDCYISAAVRCAPPDNKPSPQEARRCAPFIEAEWDLLSRKRVILALGKFAWDAAVGLIERKSPNICSNRVDFGHGAMVRFPKIVLIGSYHVSQQNTFTGKLTEKMFDDVLKQCRLICTSE